MASSRRNAVDERAAIVVAALLGIVAALHAPSPLADATASRVLVAFAVAAATWAAASAPWWAVTVAAGIAAAFAGGIVLILLGAAAAAVGLWVGIKRRDLPEIRAAVAGVAVNVLAQADLDVFFGASSAVAICIGLGLIVFGLRRRPSKIRRPAYAVGGGVATIAVLATVGFGLATLSARSDFDAGRQRARQGISALNRGDFDAAASHFQASQRAMERARSDLDKPWALPAKFVPMVSQHREAVSTVAGAGDNSIGSVSEALEAIEPDAVRLVNGQIQLASVAALESPLVDVQQSLGSLREALNDAQSPWLVGALNEELEQLDAEVTGHAPKLRNAIMAVRLAPELLGSDGARQYLVLFTTPAEARGLGGFTGNFAELMIDNGRVSMTRFGRARDLEKAGLDNGAHITGQQAFLDRYARFGYANGRRGYVGHAAWRNLTISPSFPDVAKVASELYPQSGGRPVDGVIALDPYVLEAMLKYTGPIRLESVGQTLNANNAAEYLLTGQYTADTAHEERKDALEEAAEKTFEELLTGSLPNPTTLAKDLGPFAAERRLLVWTDDADEQKLFRRVGLLGAIPRHEGANGYSVAVTNAGGSKIDTFLERRIAYSSDTEGDTGVTSATLSVDLTNGAPQSGLPRYVIGNSVDLPDGTSRLYVEFYSTLDIDQATLDGKTVGMKSGRYHGWNVYSTFVNIAPGGTAEFELQLSGALKRPDELVTWEQPLATPATIVTPSNTSNPDSPAPPDSTTSGE